MERPASAWRAPASAWQPRSVPERQLLYETWAICNNNDIWSEGKLTKIIMIYNDNNAPDKVSVHGEWTNFTTLVLGCIEAKFCK